MQSADSAHMEVLSLEIRIAFNSLDRLLSSQSQKEEASISSAVPKWTRKDVKFKRRQWTFHCRTNP